MKKLKILILCLGCSLPATVVFADVPNPNPAPEPQKTEISIGVVKPTNVKEESRMAFNRDKEILDAEYHKRLSELDGSEEGRAQRMQIMREYNAKLQQMKKALKQSLGIKETSRSGPPTVYHTAKDSDPIQSYQNDSGQQLKTFQKEPEPAKRYYRKNRNRLDYYKDVIK